MALIVAIDPNGGSGVGSNIIISPPASDRPNAPTQGEIKVDAKVSNGDARVSITQRAVTDAFERALADAKKNGNEPNGITLVLKVNTANTTVNSITFKPAEKQGCKAEG